MKGLLDASHCVCYQVPRNETPYVLTSDNDTPSNNIDNTVAIMFFLSAVQA